MANVLDGRPRRKRGRNDRPGAGLHRCVALLAVAVGLLAGTARANSVGRVKLKYLNVSPTQAAYLYVNDVQEGPYYTGAYNLQIDPVDYEGDDAALLVGGSVPDNVIATYCADIRQDAPLAWDDYYIYHPADAPIGGGNTPMGVAKAADLRRLFDLHLGDVGGSDDEAAAFQACVWEIINETTDTYDVDYLSDDKGSFYVKEYWGAASDWRLTANAWLDDVALMTEDPDIGVRVLANPDTQDFAVTIPGLGAGVPIIPEPLTMLGVFVGVCALAGHVRQRLLQAARS